MLPVAAVPGVLAVAAEEEHDWGVPTAPARGIRDDAAGGGRDVGEGGDAAAVAAAAAAMDLKWPRSGVAGAEVRPGPDSLRELRRRCPELTNRGPSSSRNTPRPLERALLARALLLAVAEPGRVPALLQPAVAGEASERVAGLLGGPPLRLLPSPPLLPPLPLLTGVQGDEAPTGPLTPPPPLPLLPPLLLLAGVQGDEASMGPSPRRLNRSLFGCPPSSCCRAATMLLPE